MNPRLRTTGLKELHDEGTTIPLNYAYYMQQIYAWKFTFGVVCFKFDSGPRVIKKFARGPLCKIIFKKVSEPLFYS